MPAGSKEPEEKAWHKNALINNKEFCCKLDTDAEANILPSFVFTGKKLHHLCELAKLKLT